MGEYRGILGTLDAVVRTSSMSNEMLPHAYEAFPSGRRWYTVTSYDLEILLL